MTLVENCRNIAVYGEIGFYAIVDKIRRNIKIICDISLTNIFPILVCTCIQTTEAAKLV